MGVSVQAPEVRNWWNIRLAGKTKSIPENNTMWNVLTTASATPILELDFLGADAHELLAFSDHAKFAALQSGKTHVKFAALQPCQVRCLAKS